MSHLSSQKSTEIRALTIEALTQRCKEYSTKIRETFRQNKPGSFSETYNIINEATNYFIELQVKARSLSDQAEVMKILKAALEDTSLEETLKQISQRATTDRYGYYIEGILENFHCARTLSMDENDKHLRGLRALMKAATTLADSKAQSSAQMDATPKPGEHTPPIANSLQGKTAAEIKAERAAKKAADAKAAKEQRQTEVSAATIRIEAAHQQTTQLLAQVQVPDAKKQPDEAEKVKAAITSATTCAAAYKELAEIPFSETELPIGDIHSKLRKTIKNFLELHGLVRTLKDTAQAQLLLEAATTQTTEFITIRPYIEKCNLSMLSESFMFGVNKEQDHDGLLRKLSYATDRNLYSDRYKEAMDTNTSEPVSAIEARQSSVSKKIGELITSCMECLGMLRELPNLQAGLPEISAAITAATEYFVTLQKELETLKATHAALIKAGRPDSIKQGFQASLIKLKYANTADFISYVEKLNLEASSKKDLNDLISTFLQHKNALITDTVPVLTQSGEPAESKETNLEAIEKHYKEAQQGREKLITQLTSTPSKPNLPDVIATIRAIIENIKSIEEFTKKEGVDQHLKTTAQALCQDLRELTYIKNLTPLVTKNFSKDAGKLLNALNKNDLSILEQPAKTEAKGTTQEENSSAPSSPSRKISTGTPSQTPEKKRGGFMGQVLSRLTSNSSPSKITNTTPSRPMSNSNIPVTDPIPMNMDIDALISEQSKVSGEAKGTGTLVSSPSVVGRPSAPSVAVTRMTTGTNMETSDDLILLDDIFPPPAQTTSNLVSSASSSTQFGQRNPANTPQGSTPSPKSTGTPSVSDTGGSAKNHESDESYESPEPDSIDI